MVSSAYLRLLIFISVEHCNPGLGWINELYGDDRMRWLDGIAEFEQFWEIVKGSKAWHAAVLGVAKNWRRLSD